MGGRYLFSHLIRARSLCRIRNPRLTSLGLSRPPPISRRLPTAPQHMLPILRLELLLLRRAPCQPRLRLALFLQILQLLLRLDHLLLQNTILHLRYQLLISPWFLRVILLILFQSIKRRQSRLINLSVAILPFIRSGHRILLVPGQSVLIFIIYF